MAFSAHRTACARAAAGTGGFSLSFISYKLEGCKPYDCCKNQKNGNRAYIFRKHGKHKLPFFRFNKLLDFNCFVKLCRFLVRTYKHIYEPQNKKECKNRSEGAKEGLIS